MSPVAGKLSRSLAYLAEELTPCESDVLQILVNGLGNKEIAARLLISEHTVKYHVASILGKLDAGKPHPSCLYRHLTWHRSFMIFVGSGADLHMLTNNVHYLVCDSALSQKNQRE